MDLTPPNNFNIVKNVQSMSISRRGGVRTRGGRLPPISMREITQVTGNKKVIVPNIPQRRKVIKKEPEIPAEPLIKTEPKENTQDSRGRSRGRKQKVFLQTEGTFLAEGPAARIKRDPVYDESFSVSRISRNATSESCGKKIDSETIKDLLECHGDDEDSEDESESVRQPYRLPLQKEKVIHKAKLEPSEDVVKKEIKKEFIEDFETGITREIKTEAEFDSSKDKIATKIETCLKTEVKSSAEEFRDVKDGGMLILLQVPQMPSNIEAEVTEKSTKDKQKQDENDSKIASNFDNLEEGFIGKLRIMKSGRMKLALGSAEFELFDGNQSESYQEAVSLRTREDETDLAIMDKIERKLILIPIINNGIANDCETVMTPSNE